MALSIKMASSSANNFIYFLCLSALLTNFAKFAGMNSYCEDCGVAYDVSVNSIPYVAVATPELEGVDMGSGAARQASSVPVAAPTTLVVSPATLTVCPLGLKTLVELHSLGWWCKLGSIKHPIDSIVRDVNRDTTNLYSGEDRHF
ncbi:hypothetical protein HAX54_049930 [Datura stramonium]|uniref:Uncharacterized protein n=1 Tax=Datura stramonium TaxID=4076 RepID=A0ABS8SVM9_DATST|nr:hypothetical protein [Datura stramonium]